jgi:hypothetical protein
MYIQTLFRAKIVHNVVVVNLLPSREVFIKVPFAKFTVICQNYSALVKKRFKIFDNPPVTMLFANLKAAKQGPEQSL